MRPLRCGFKRFFSNVRLVLAALAVVLFLVQVGCRVQAGNPQTSKPIKPGNVTVAIADAPVAGLSQLFMTIHAVGFAPEGTGRCLSEPKRQCADSSLYYFELDNEIEIDLLSLSDGRTQVLPFSQNLPAGTYEGIRLFLSENIPMTGVLEEDGRRVNVEFERGPFGRREFTIVEEFDIAEDTQNEILVHVDLRRSLRRRPDNSYELKPTTHVVPTRLAARLSGTVSDQNVKRVCAYLNGGRRRPDGQRLMGDKSQPGRRLVSDLALLERHGYEPGMQNPMQPPDQGGRRGPGGPSMEGSNRMDTTSTCENAEAVSDVTNGSYDLRYLPPVSYTLRLFKSDGTYSDTPVTTPLNPQESRVLDL